MSLHNKIMNLPAVITGEYSPSESLRFKVGHKQARHAAAELALDTDAELERVTLERDVAILMLAEWCVDIDEGGSIWDAWDESYKSAKQQPGPLRGLLDAAIAEETARRNAAE